MKKPSFTGRGTLSAGALATVLLLFSGATQCAAQGLPTLSIDGELKCNNCLDFSDYRLRVTGISDGIRRDFWPETTGSFHLAGLAEGTYSFDVIGSDETLLHHSLVQVPLAWPLQVDLAGAAAANLKAKPVSIQNLGRPRNKKAWKEYERAVASRKKDDLDAAEQHFQKALEIDPHLAPAWNDYGAMLLQHGRAVDSETIFRRALQEDPANAMAATNLSNCLLQMRRFAEAEKQARSALHWDSANPNARYALGLALAMQNKEPEEAVFYLKQVSDRYPQSLLVAAQIDQNRGQIASARQSLQSYLGMSKVPHRERVTKWLESVDRLYPAARAASGTQSND